MQQEWTYVDRSTWPEGPWDLEKIDKKVWKDPETGLDCMIRRGVGGAWCGYVGIKKGHRFYGMDYSNYDELCELYAHGGLTFSDKCHDNDQGTGICHPADDGDHVWWFGFDCAHLKDLTPGYMGVSGYGEEYRDIHYVTREVTELAKQLA